MDTAEFDKVADEYVDLHVANIRLSGETPAYFAEYKVRDFRRIVSRAAAGNLAGRYLDFGAGTGNAVQFFDENFPEGRLTCVDVSRRSLAIAAQRFGGLAEFLVFDGRTLPMRSNSFAGAYANCVFHHIPGLHHVSLLKELCRVLAPGAPIMVYEHNPLNPLTVRAVNTCVFDENAVLIRTRLLMARLRDAGFRDVHAHYRVFFPRALRALRPFEHLLTWLPFGAQYFATGVK